VWLGEFDVAVMHAVDAGWARPEAGAPLRQLLVEILLSSNCSDLLFERRRTA